MVKRVCRCQQIRVLLAQAGLYSRRPAYCLQVSGGNIVFRVCFEPALQAAASHGPSELSSLPLSLVNFWLKDVAEDINHPQE